jgi:CRP-like cAMP-binding protein
MLLKEENDAYNVPVEKKAMYERFARKGMSPVDFLQLISAAKRVEVKKGDVIVDEGRKNTRVYFIKSGRLSVIKNGAKIREIQTNQFTGEMSFIRWEERIDTDTYLSKAKKSTNKMWEKWETKDTETELFLPLLVVCESLIERWGLREQMASRPEQATTSVHSVQGSHAGAGVKGDISEEAGYAGITVDANGNVLASDADDSSSGRQTAQEQTLFGRYLNASYNFLGGLLSSHTEQTNAEEGAAQPGSANEGEFAAATVVAEEDCVLYFWSFKRLHALIEQHPSLGRSFERVLSEDLNKKMVTTMALEPGHRYQLLLAAATMDGEVSVTLHQYYFYRSSIRLTVFFWISY